MKTTHALLILCALILSACEMPQQRGLFGADSEVQKAADEAAAAAKNAPEEEEEFKLNDQYSQEDLDAVSEFVEIRAAVSAVEKSLAQHPRQGIKTGYLNRGIAMTTSEHSAYWFKDGTLYSANPFARAYSPELPEAPGEITEEGVRAAVEIGTDNEDAKEVSSGARETFIEFVSLIEYVNTALLEDDESAKVYAYSFLNDLTPPISPADEMTQELETIERFHRLFNTIAQEQPETYDELNIAQSLTIYTFGRITKDMKHEQVARILGGAGKEEEKADKGEDMITMFAWRSDGVSNMYAFFRNDHLFDKVIAGYN